jgi:hypothetical protein
MAHAWIHTEIDADLAEGELAALVIAGGDTFADEFLA